ncbi:MAG TPA: PAS domain-containing protein [Rhizomicrobium sp.]|nr:PAS domain-containing protein [Rhizomicrobium sp.]
MTPAEPNGQRTFTRSPESRAFEAFWRSLRNETLVPAREDFHPGKARNLISDLVLVEARDSSAVSQRIRVTGGRFDELIGYDIRGCNPADFLPRAYRAGVIESTRLMFEMPCGVWQITPAHLVHGYATHLEMTMLPLGPDKAGSHFLLVHVRSVGDLMRAYLPTPNGLGLDTSTTFEFLDVGAGVPEWTAQAA